MRREKVTKSREISRTNDEISRPSCSYLEKTRHSTKSLALLFSVSLSNTSTICSIDLNKIIKVTVCQLLNCSPLKHFYHLFYRPNQSYKSDSMSSSYLFPICSIDLNKIIKVTVCQVRIVSLSNTFIICSIDLNKVIKVTVCQVLICFPLKHFSHPFNKPKKKY
jgi:hypothetical protein